ncbi:hypothetical protein LCGC14_1949980 [marine sediment metagenome]|uniref:Uncharacterized protein n=1 Tax=marine sediment metagenome TaxID=412755 RepID=A0A0F9IER8_9ZZZZ
MTRTRIIRIIEISLFLVVGMLIVLTPVIITSNVITKYTNYCEERNWDNSIVKIISASISSFES